jgi:hypothetical protein
LIAQRLPHQDHAPSPFRTVAGVWAPPFQPPRVLLPLDLTLAVLNEHGEELFRAAEPGVFAAGPNAAGVDAGAVVQAADGRPLGVITEYGLPGDHPLVPVTWARPAANLPRLPRFERALTAEQCEAGVSARVLTYPPMEGTLLGGPRPEPYLGFPGVPAVEALRVRLSAAPPGDLRRHVGAAITCCCDERVLVGIMIDFRPAGVRWDALCYPAFLF